MRLVNRQVLFGLGLGLVVAASAVVVHAHTSGSAPHAMPAGPSDLLSISGSPEELAARSERLAEHVCATIGTGAAEAGAACPLPALATVCANDLRGLNERYREGMRDLHQTLLGPTPDAATWQLVEGRQLDLIDTASRRYLRFLADVAASLDAAQKQRFAH